MVVFFRPTSHGWLVEKTQSLRTGEEKETQIVQHFLTN